MTIRKFRIEVTRTDEYIIEIDDEIYNNDWIADFEQTMYPLDDGIESIAKDIAQFRARVGKRFQEGYGCISENGCMTSSLNQEDYAEGIDITVESEDDDIQFDVDEL